jgi:hypothetical protein
MPNRYKQVACPSNDRLPHPHPPFQALPFLLPIGVGPGSRGHRLHQHPVPFTPARLGDPPPAIGGATRMHARREACIPDQLLRTWEARTFATQRPVQSSPSPLQSREAGVGRAPVQPRARECSAGAVHDQASPPAVPADRGWRDPARRTGAPPTVRRGGATRHAVWGHGWLPPTRGCVAKMRVIFRADRVGSTVQGHGARVSLGIGYRFH